MAVLKLWRELFLFIRFDANRNTYTGVWLLQSKSSYNPRFNTAIWRNG